MTIALSNFRDALGFFPNGVAIITTIARDRARNDGEFVQAGSARQRRCAPDHRPPYPIPTRNLPGSEFRTGAPARLNGNCTLRRKKVDSSRSHLGHSRPMHSVPLPINVRCYSNSDMIVRRSEVTRRASNGLIRRRKFEEISAGRSVSSGA
jgi:hypothetical protein